MDADVAARLHRFLLIRCLDGPVLYRIGQSGSLLYGSWAVGIPMVPGLIGEGVVNMIAAYALAACLVKAKFHGYGYSLKR